jgi:hypothetical protein
MRRVGGLAAAVLFFGVALAGCGEEPGTVATDAVPKSPEPPNVDVATALAAPGDMLRVEGTLLAPERGVFRLCTTLETTPPDYPLCANPYLIVQAIDLTAVEGLTTEAFAQRGEVTYSPEPVTLTGSVTGAVLLIDPESPESGVSGSPENPSGTTTSTAG